MQGTFIGAIDQGTTGTRFMVFDGTGGVVASEYDPDRVREYDREAFEAMVGQPPEIGLHVEAENGLHGDVTAVTEEAVQVDFNHELAGKTLVFDLEVLEVR